MVDPLPSAGSSLQENAGPDARLEGGKAGEFVFLIASLDEKK